MANAIDIPNRAGRYTSGALCDAAGLSRGALRLYEREKLIEEPPRSEGGYRLYPAETADLLMVIKEVKALGFSLADIKELLGLLNGEGGDASELRALALRHIADIDARIAGLSELRDCLSAFAESDACEYDDECAALGRLMKRRGRAAAAPKSDPPRSARS